MKGRTAVFELLAMSDGLREMVLRHCDSNEMRACAIRDGMVTMRDAGVRRVLQGVTTPDEVVRVLFSEEF